MLGLGYEEIEMLARGRADDLLREAELRRLRDQARQARAATPAVEIRRRPTVLRWIPRPNR